MPESFNPVEYLSHVRGHWRLPVLSAIAAVALTAAACWVLPAQYTATAMLVIEPPAGTDPRTATAVSPVYLESLKTYEQFASSNTLFSKAAEKLHLSPDGPIESFKQRVLRVNKPKETKVLEISATLNDPKQAQALAQFLAEETVALNRSLARSGDGDALADLDQQLVQARAALNRTREERSAAEKSGSEAALELEVRDLADLRFRVSEQLISANALLAELTEREPGAELSATRARANALEAQKASLERDWAAKNAALAGLRARLLRAEDESRVAQATLETLSQKANELAAGNGQHSEQLRVIDPGIVPQRPSFPRPALYTSAAFFIAIILSLAYLTLQFGLLRQRAWNSPTELKVARGGR